MPDEPGQKRNLYSVSVCFLVDDLVKSAKYYRDVLGFSFNRYLGEPPCFVMVQRGSVELFFSSNGAKGNMRPNHVAFPEFTWDAYVRCHNVNALYQSSKQKARRSSANRKSPSTK